MTNTLVDADWLIANLGNVRVLDASYHLPTAKRDPKSEFEAERIKGAQFFDVDAISDRSNGL